ncbi:hypothetical protein D3C73_1357820 [compost metagenome]
MIHPYRAVETTSLVSFNSCKHIRLTVIMERLHEFLRDTAYIAEMNVAYFVSFPQLANQVRDIFPSRSKGPLAKCYSAVFARYKINCFFHGCTTSYDPRDSPDRGNWRITWMQSELHLSFLRYRNDSFQEIFQVIP